MKKVLVIAAHPDDETLGCGGTMLTRQKNGDSIDVLICCEWKSMRQHTDKQDLYVRRAMEKLKVHKLHALGFVGQRLEELPLLTLVRRIEEVVEEVKPEVIYTHFKGDNNQDHRRVFEAAMVAARPLREELRAVYSFYTVSSTEWGRDGSFVPDTWVDITDVMPQKLEAFACYQSEVKPFPHPRSVEALESVAKYFGNQCLMPYAEAFQTVMRLVRPDQADRGKEDES